MRSTASSLDRLVNCPASTFLSGASGSSEYAERGTAGHAFLEHIANGKSVDDAVKLCDPEYESLYRAIDVESLFYDLRDVKTESAYAVDFELQKVRFIGQSIGRAYGDIGENEIAGSTDVMATRISDGMPIIRDYKFGQHHGAKSFQQMFFATVCYLMGVEDVESQVVAIEADGPRMGRYELLSEKIGFFDVEEFMTLMRDACRRAKSQEAHWLATGSVSVKMGTWCDYCPAKAAGSCPAYAGLAKSMVSDLTELSDRLAALTPIQAGQAWLKYKEAERLLELIGKGLRGMCSEDNPLPIGEEKELRPTFQNRTSMNSELLLKLATKLGASDSDLASCMKTSTFPIYRIMKKDKQ